jgi:hypothetical protein
MSIQIVRLNSGEELLCQVEAIPGNFYRLTDIAILIPTRENSIGLMPFMPYSTASELLDIQASFVAFMTDPVEGLIEQHQQMFSRIITPNNKFVL